MFQDTHGRWMILLKYTYKLIFWQDQICTFMHLVYVILGPGHVTFWRLCTDQELEKEKLAKMALESQDQEELTDLDVSTADLTRQDEEEPEEKSGVVMNLLMQTCEEQRKLIPGMLTILDRKG